MKKQNKLSVLMGLFITAMALSSCGSGENGDGPSGKTTNINFWGIIEPGSNVNEAYKKLVDDYNKGQGKKDKVSVRFIPKSDNSSTQANLCSGPVASVDVIGCNDRYVFNNIAQGAYANLTELMKDETLITVDENNERYFKIDNYSRNNIDRFRFNTETLVGGGDENLYGLPLMSTPTTIYYNETFFKSLDINIISVSEDELDHYNKTNGTKFAARGYAEYLPSATPKSGLKVSKNLNGEDVVKVFNNLIPCSYLEIDTLSKLNTKAYNPNSKSKYGILNEWWFSHGWSVGGDCIKYDESLGQYKFTLGDNKKNFLVTGKNGFEINGRKYEEGEILSYKDRNYVYENNLTTESALYELPSQYEQFREFCALSQEKGKKVDNEVNGYGISPSPLTLGNMSMVNYFTSGNVAMTVQGIGALRTITDSIRNTEWDVCPMYTYREFEGEDPSGNGTLRVIGEEYDGKIFEGIIKEVNGTRIEGILSGSDVNIGWFIANNSKKKEAAFKFLQFLTSKKGQSYFIETNIGVPTHKDLVFSDEFLNSSNKLCKNYKGLAIMSEACEIGDWSYLEDGSWITPWSSILNSDVRNGAKTLDVFFNEVQDNIDGLLKKYRFRLHGKE